MILIVILTTLDFFMSIAAGFYRFSFIFIDPLAIEDDPKAEVYVFLSFLWGLGLRISICIPFLFTLSIYLTVKYRHRRNDTKAIILYLVCLLLVSILWASVPLFFDGYGMNEDAALTIVSPLLVFLAFYLPLIMLIVITLIVIFLTLKLLDFTGPYIRYVCFPIVLIICYFFSIIRRVLNICDVDSVYLRFVMNALVGLQSVLNLFYCVFMVQKTNSFVEFFACGAERQTRETLLEEQKEEDHNEDEDSDDDHNYHKEHENENLNVELGKEYTHSH